VLGTHDLGLFVVTALVLNATPGADFLYTVARTLQTGLRGGVAAALGISAGCVVHALAAAAGLAAVLTASAVAFDAVKWAGAAYLLWLALGLLRSARRPVAAATRSQRSLAAASMRRIFVQGFLTNVLNPKVALFFLALLPQFVAADAADKPLALLFLGALFVVNGTLFLLALAAVVARMRRVRAAPWAGRALNATGAALFAALAARLALAERA
jgi:threonine/homoserine/homoserine lactone efflux protein